jgi:hypothetical protein
MNSSECDVLHTVTDVYDGPRKGVTSFDGRPYVYESEWDDSADEYAPTYRLSPISAEVLALALEDWEIWLRWQSACREGKTGMETHPALPQDRGRHDQLQEILKEQLVIDETCFVRAKADFRRLPSGLAVKWSLVDHHD